MEIETKKEILKAIVCYVNIANESSNVERDLDELQLLCEADNFIVVGRLLQNLHEANASTLIGEGKLDELKELCKTLKADVVVFENDLSGSKIKNITNATGAQVLTRSMIILDIFATRAATNEGKLQTELAQLKYMSSRLSHIDFSGEGKYKSSVGSRGPGETRLELDRRKIKNRIAKLEESLDRIEKQRDVNVNARIKSQIKNVTLVGYTNSGKSTIFNAITKANVLSKDMLFATLDTTSRQVWLDFEHKFVLSDTVGFVNKLPHEFIEAFKSTIKEAATSDLLLIVVDATSKNAFKEYSVVKSVLNDVGAGKIRNIIVLNKIDNPINEEQVKLIKQESKEYIEISALKKIGIDELKNKIKKYL